jgi:hypothetical protein
MREVTELKNIKEGELENDRARERSLVKKKKASEQQLPELERLRTVLQRKND